MSAIFRHTSSFPFLTLGHSPKIVETSAPFFLEIPSCNFGTVPVPVHNTALTGTHHLVLTISQHFIKRSQYKHTKHKHLIIQYIYYPFIMLNDNLFHYFPIHTSTSYHQQPAAAAFTFYDPEEEERRRRLRRLRAAALLDQERRRRYYATAIEQEQALLEELERRRQQRLYEEELERRRRRQEQEQQQQQRLQRLLYEEEMERRRLAALERQRAAAEAAERKKLWLMEMKKKKEQQEEAERNRRRRELLIKQQQEEEEAALKKKLRSIPTSRNCASTSMFYPQQQIVRGLDGNLYRIVYPTSAGLSPASTTAAKEPRDEDVLGGVHVADPFFGLFDDDHAMMDISNSLPTKTSVIGKSLPKKNKNHGNENDDDGNETVLSSTEEESVSTTSSSSDESSDSEVPTRTMARMNAAVSPQEEKKNDKPVFKNVTYNININHAEDNINKKDDATVPTSNTATTTSMKKAVKPKSSSKTKKKKEKSAMKRSSVLIGDVENASDSECEDVYGDYFHNRRPSTPGTWIEPVEGYGVRTLR